jgi:hypothetical protein
MDDALIAEALYRIGPSDAQSFRIALGRFAAKKHQKSTKP